MIVLLIILFVSLLINGVLFWYTKKLIQNLRYGVNNVDELQKLLDEYVTLLKPLVEMENYYGDPVIISTIKNTKMIIDACTVYKNSIIENENEETKKNKSIFNEEKDIKEEKEKNN